jgi:hypothetical protein
MAVFSTLERPPANTLQTSVRVLALVDKPSCSRFSGVLSPREKLGSNAPPPRRTVSQVLFGERKLIANQSVRPGSIVGSEEFARKFNRPRRIGGKFFLDTAVKLHPATSAHCANRVSRDVAHAAVERQRTQPRQNVFGGICRRSRFFANQEPSKFPTSAALE